MELQERFLRARRNVIAADFSKLNDMQRSAVLATEGPLLLLAGAAAVRPPFSSTGLPISSAMAPVPILRRSHPI